MNKKKFSYILFIVFLFSFFNVEVEAAKELKELSCVYYEEDSEYAVKIAQNNIKYVDGEYGYVFVTEKDKVVENGKVNFEGDWGDAYIGITSLKVLATKDNSYSIVDYFDSCPAAVTIKKSFGKASKTIYAFSSSSHDVYELHKSEKNVFGSYNFFAMTFKDEDDSFVDTSSTVEDSHEQTYNQKTCDKVDWITKPNNYASCLYTYYVDDSNDNLDGCFVVQIDFDESGKLNLNGNPPNDRIVIDRNVLPVLDSAYLKNKTDGRCPANVYAKQKNGYQGTTKSYQFSFEIESSGDTWLTFNLKDWDGKNLVTGEDMTGYEYDGYNLNFVSGGDITCADIIGENGELVDVLNMLVTLVKILVPILLIVLGSLDFVKAIFSGDDSNMKKAQNKFIKRLLIGIIFFLAPSLLKFILEIANNIWPVIDADLCGIL